MADIDRIVDVVISRQTTTPSMESFNGILIAAEFLRTQTVINFGATERVRVYGSLAEVLAAGFTADTFVYRAAARVFGQSPSPSQVYVGRKKTGGDGTETWSDALTAMALENAGWYGVVVSTRDYTLQQGVATWIEANEKLCVMASADANIVNGTSDTNHTTITLAGDLVASNVITSTINGTAVATTWNTDHATTMADHIDDINANATLIAAGISAAAGATNRIIVLTAIGLVMTTTCVITLGATQTTATITTSTAPTDIAAWLKANSIERTGVFYDPLAGNSTYEDCIDAAMFGVAFAKDPGSITWAFKSLALVTVYTLTPAQFIVAADKRANVYTSIAGVNCTQMGTVGSGEYFDIMHGIDWLKARIQNRIFTPIVQQDKVPFTDTGVEIIVGQLKAALQEGVDVGLLASYETAAPRVADVSADKKAARTLPDVTFTAVLQGAIHKVEIDGVVTL